MVLVGVEMSFEDDVKVECRVLRKLRLGTARVS